VGATLRPQLTGKPRELSGIVADARLQVRGPFGLIASGGGNASIDLEAAGRVYALGALSADREGLASRARN
jgi:hypothetical protein